VSISYFILEKGIIEREDLSIYEKMCCVVLAKWAAEEKEGFDTLTLAREMSCTERKATETIRQLKQKGFIQSEGPSEASPAPRVIKAENVEGLKPIRFEEADKSDRPLSREDLMAGVQDIIEETINDSEARIILNFAGDDLEKVKRCYKIAKNMQISDTIEALIIELQRKEKPPATLETINRQVKNSVGPYKETKDYVTKTKVVESSNELYKSDDLLSRQLLEEIKIPDLQGQGFEQAIETVWPTENTWNSENVEGSENTEHVESAESLESAERPWYLDDDDDLDDVIKPPSTQINANMINKMKAYKRYGK